MSPEKSHTLLASRPRARKGADNLMSDIRAHGSVAYVTLTQGYVATIDVADIPLVWGFNWSVMARDQAVYAKSAITVDGIRQPVFMHRLLLGLEYGDPVEVDHKDGDGLNNRRLNLRTASQRQQIQNRSLPGSRDCGYRGVTWKAKRKKWLAKITIDGKARYLGHFDCEREASGMYEYVAQILHGEFYRPPKIRLPEHQKDYAGMIPPVAAELLAKSL